MRRAKKVLVIVLLVLSLLLGGCGSLIQPSRSDLVEANEDLQSSPAKLAVSMDLISNDIALSYSSTININGECASWVGTATAYYLQSFFTQECISVCNSEGSYKKWRSCWTVSQSTSPASQIATWLQAIENGDGTYLKQPVIPAEVITSLSSASSEAYCVHLDREQINWKSLIDVNPDSLFGGDELITVFNNCDVYLFFDVRNLRLNNIVITRTTNSNWIEVVIDVSSTEEFPKTMPADTEITVGVLSEEWEMSNAKEE